MDIYIKNNNLYYKDHIIYDHENKELFKNKLSIVLIPIGLFILIHKKFIKYFSYAFLCIAIIGTIEIYYLYLKSPNIYLLLAISAIIHLLFLYPLVNIKKYMIPNKINYLTGLCGLLIIIFLPYWPYIITRQNTALLTIIIYILATFFYKFYSK